MSMCIRPVIETWGESLTFSSRDVPIVDLLDGIADIEGFERAENLYGDMNVFWVQEGRKFLEYLVNTPLADIIPVLEENGLITSENEERERQIEDLKALADYAPVWMRTSIDPQDGSLRIYSD